jgi:hypothetical protein
VFGPTHRLAVRVAEVPLLTGLDQAAHELAVDQLGSAAGGATSAANEACSDKADPLPTPGAMPGARVSAAVDGRTGEITTSARAVLRVP